MFFKIGALKNLAIFKGKHLCWSLFLIKLQACNFPVNVAKFLKNSFFHKTPSAAASEKFINFRGKHQWRRCNRLIFLIRQYVNVLLTLISERFSRRDLKSQWLFLFQYWNASLPKIIPRKSSSGRTKSILKFKINYWSNHLATRKSAKLHSPLERLHSPLERLRLTKTRPTSFY